jgi:carboxylesterase type B
MYQLDFGAPTDGGKMRAYHTYDIALVFDTLDKPKAPRPARVRRPGRWPTR